MHWWQLAGIGAASLAAAAVLVVTQRWHNHWTGDFQDSGIQKHHTGSPPRVGALALAAGLVLALFMLAQAADTASRGAYTLLLGVCVASLPAVVLGLADDLTKRVPPRARMLGAAVAGVAAMLMFQGYVPRVNIPGLDALVTIGPVAVLLTLLMVCGFTNAMNIVDGLNGLSGNLALMMLAATGFAALWAGDLTIVTVCLVLAAAIAGFLVANFPRGLIFLGDGAAYFIGFALAQVWMLLLARNADISTWFVVAVAAHPTMETVFSMYRRRIHRGRGGAFTQADRLHLHTLVYRRRTRSLLQRHPGMRCWVPNALASLQVAGFAALPMVAACLAPTSTAWCASVLGAYVVGYVLWFRKLVWFGRMFRPEAPVAAEALQPSAPAAANANAA